jgi:hypothetical protein
LKIRKKIGEVRNFDTNPNNFEEYSGFHGGEDEDAENFSPEDGDSMLLRNVGIYRRVYTAPKPRGTAPSTLRKLERILPEFIHRNIHQFV